MKIAYFPAQVALNGAPVMSAMLDSAKACGMQLHENSWTADAAIIWSVLWAGRMRANQEVYQHYRAQHKPVIIVEVGALDRGRTWKISVNNVTADGYYGHHDRLDMDRPQKLNVNLSQPINSQPHVVVALQHTRSLQVENIPDMTQWIHETVATLKGVTDRPIVVRLHPRSSCVVPTGVAVEKPRKLGNTYDSYNMQFDCHAVINYNSGPGIQAAIAGVRPIVDATSLAHPVSIPWHMMEQPYLVDRDLWLAQICHTEYTVDEIKQGLWLNRIKSALTV